jgi:DNA-binding response OmpR family regulator
MWSSGIRVLLVEDDKELGDMIKKALSVEGYEVDWVQDGFLALKNLSEKDYDLLLLDLMLPRFDGIKICKKGEGKQRHTHFGNYRPGADRR